MREHWKEPLARVQVSALDYLTAMLRLPEPGSDVLSVTRAERELLLACRDVTRAVDALPMGDQPKGWVA